MSSLDDRPFPTAALVGAGLLVLSTVAGVGALQLAKHFSPPAEEPSAVAADSVVKARVLRFVDAGDGASVYGGHVTVFDATTGTALPELRDNEGFIRAVLNSLAFERTKRGISADPVFKLASWSSNRMTLEDPATGARISLGAFGADNRSVFLRFFDQRGARS